jgi:hypothetical protein
MPFLQFARNGGMRVGIDYSGKKVPALEVDHPSARRYGFRICMQKVDTFSGADGGVLMAGSSRQAATAYRLLATDYRLPPTCQWLLATGFWLSEATYSTFVG